MRARSSYNRAPFLCREVTCGEKVSQVDLLARTIRLNPGQTKNKEGRTVTLTESCYALVLDLVKGKRTEDFLLTRSNGEPVLDFRGAWESLTEAAKMLGLLFARFAALRREEHGALQSF